MEILFQGLICHARVRDPADNIERQIAVLMNAPGHRPVFTVANTDIEAATNAPPIGSGPGVTCFGARDRIETNLGSGLSTVSLPNVPRLTDSRIASGGGAPNNVHPAVLGRNPNAAFHAYLELPVNGTLNELDLWEDQASFNGVAFGCIARTTIYSIATGANVIFEIRGRQLVVKPNARLILRNTSILGGGPPHPHFPEYKTFFLPPAAQVWPPIRTTVCPNGSPPPLLPACTGLIDLDVDCSNTQFP